MLLLAPAWVHSSNAVPSIDPDIVDVRSAGWWEESGHGGIYRVVVRHFGFEHINSRVSFEWVLDGDRDTKGSIRHSVVFADALLASVTIDSLQATKTGVLLVLEAELHDGSPYRCEVQLQPGGRYKSGAGC
jgi:hypothetical protein